MLYFLAMLGIFIWLWTRKPYEDESYKSAWYHYLKDRDKKSDSSEVD